MNKLIILFLLIGTAISSTSCKKEENNPNQVSREQQLKGKEWKLSSAELNPTVQGIDPMAFLGECQTDNIFIFSDNGILNVDENEKKCSESAPQSLTGTWDLSDDESQLSLNYGTYSTDAQILELTDDKLKISTLISYQGFDVNLISTFTTL